MSLTNCLRVRIGTQPGLNTISPSNSADKCSQGGLLGQPLRTHLELQQSQSTKYGMQRHTVLQEACTKKTRALGNAEKSPSCRERFPTIVVADFVDAAKIVVVFAVYGVEAEGEIMRPMQAMLPYGLRDALAEDKLERIKPFIEV